jgi:NitT/TauT family transport system substrate-binding protein
MALATALTAVAASAVAACGSASSTTGTTASAGQASLSVVMGYVADVEDYGFEYALHQGLYAKEGLNVKLIPGGQGIDQVQEVEAGVAQVGVGNAESIITAAGKGDQLKVFGTEFQRSPVAMTCRQDSGVTTPSQLKGKTVGVKPTAAPLLSLFLEKNGLSVGDIHQVPVGASDISEIIAGKVQCEFTTFAFNEPQEIRNQGVQVNVIPLANYGLPAQEDAFFVKQSFYASAANRALLVKFLKATASGWMSMFKNPTAAAKYEVKGAFVDGLDLNQQIFQASQQVLYMKGLLTPQDGLLALDPAVWQQTAKNLFAEKVTTSTVPTANLVTNALVQQADLPKI